MALPRPADTESLRRRFPRFSPPLMELLEACLQARRWAVWQCGRWCVSRRKGGASAGRRPAPSVQNHLPPPAQPDPAHRPSVTALLSLPYFTDAPTWLTPDFLLAQARHRGGGGGCRGAVGGAQAQAA